MVADALPEGYSVRAPTVADAGEVAAIMAACQEADGDTPDVTAEEVRDEWAGIDLAEEARVVVGPDGRLAASVDLLNRRFVQVSVYGYVHPEHRGRGLGGFLVDWGEAWTRRHMHRALAQARIDVQHYVRSTNAGHRRLLEARGYAPVRAVYVMAIELDDPPPAPEWPDGVRPRTFVPGQDERATFEAVEEAFRDIWGRPRGTYERWLAVTEAERRDPGLWFLAVEPGGQIAGVCLGKESGGSGWVGAVGVRRPWRGRGLGLALLRQLFAEYHRRGVREVGLSVDAESLTGAPRLYARAGMRVTRDYIIYRKELRPGVDVSFEEDEG